MPHERDVNPELEQKLNALLEEDVLSRDAIRQHPVLGEIVLDTAWKYLTILEEFRRADKEMLAHNDGLIKIMHEDVQDSGHRQRLIKAQMAVSLKGEHRLRAVAHMSALNEETHARLMQHEQAIDDYRKSLIGHPSDGQRRFRDWLLKEDSEAGRAEAAERLVGSMVRRVLNIMRDEYQELSIPEKFDPKDTHKTLGDEQRSIRRSMQHFFGPTPDHKER